MTAWLVVMRVADVDHAVGPLRLSLAAAQAEEARIRSLAARERWDDLGALLGSPFAPDDLGPVRLVERVSDDGQPAARAGA